MPADRRSLASEGEQLAAEHLARAGYRIAARNVRADGVEIDLVADGAGTARSLSFDEVKTRAAGAGFGAPRRAEPPPSPPPPPHPAPQCTTVCAPVRGGPGAWSTSSTGPGHARARFECDLREARLLRHTSRCASADVVFDADWRANGVRQCASTSATASTSPGDTRGSGRTPRAIRRQVAGDRARPAHV